MWFSKHLKMNSLWSLFLCLLCAILCLNVCGAYKILVVFPIAGKSHGILGDGVVRHLLNAGHEVLYSTTEVLIRQIIHATNNTLSRTINRLIFMWLKRNRFRHHFMNFERILLMVPLKYLFKGFIFNNNLAKFVGSWAVLSRWVNFNQISKV